MLGSKAGYLPVLETCGEMFQTQLGQSWEQVTLLSGKGYRSRTLLPQFMVLGEHALATLSFCSLPRPQPFDAAPEIPLPVDIFVTGERARLCTIG